MDGISVCAAMDEYLAESLHETTSRAGVRVSDETKAYLILLLRKQLRGGIQPDEAVAPVLAGALDRAQPRAVRRERFRSVGDACLVSCGLWWMRNERPRRTASLDFYLHAGPMAYRQLDDDPLFRQLSRKFSDLVDVLVTMHLTGDHGSANDVLRLFRIWVRTRSVHAERLLARHGVTVLPNASSTPS